jgi:hypothetical protein
MRRIVEQDPVRRMLPCPPADSKAHVVLDGGHVPARPQEAYKVILDWLDAKLGAVR